MKNEKVAVEEEKVFAEEHNSLNIITNWDIKFSNNLKKY
jgi:hypothetical protein